MPNIEPLRCSAEVQCLTSSYIKLSLGKERAESKMFKSPHTHLIYIKVIYWQLLSYFVYFFFSVIYISFLFLNFYPEKDRAEFISGEPINSMSDLYFPFIYEVESNH